MSIVTNIVQQAEQYIKDQIAAADIAGKLSAVEDDVLTTIDNGVTAIADAAHGVLTGEIANNILALKVAELIQGHGGGKFKAKVGHRMFLRFTRRSLAHLERQKTGCSFDEAVARVNKRYAENDEGNALLLSDLKKKGVEAPTDGTFWDWISQFLKTFLPILLQLLPLLAL